MSAQPPSRSPRSPRSRPNQARREQARRAAIIRRRRALSALGILVVLLGALFALRHHPSPHADGATTPKRPRSFAVGILTCRFVDHSRATPDFLHGTSSPGRVLETEIRYPTLVHAQVGEEPGAAIARTWGPYPLIVFAHGYKISPDTYARLLDSWAASGLVVASPIFPDTNAAAVAADNDSSLNENDDINQPGDVAFVTRQMLADSGAISPTCPRMYRVIKKAEVAVAGQSDGADTVAALEYDSHYETTGLSVRATAVLSGQEFPPPTGEADPYAAAHGPALLVVQSKTDQCNPPQDSSALYNDIAQSDKWFLALTAADHLPPYSGTDQAAFSLVSSVTTRFFDSELGVPGLSKSLLAVGNSQPLLGKLTSGPPRPVMPSLNQLPSACYLGATP